MKEKIRYLLRDINLDLSRRVRYVAILDNCSSYSTNFKVILFILTLPLIIFFNIIDNLTKVFVSEIFSRFVWSDDINDDQEVIK